MTSTEQVVQLNIGDTVPVGTVLANLMIMGIVTDVNNPNMFAATLQAFQSQAVLTVPVLQGIQGVPGNPTFALQFQNQPLATPGDLPTNLGDTTDLGKYWVFGVTDQNGNVIATTMYVWYGTDIGFQEFPIGSPGPAGPAPLITPNIILVAPGNGNGPGGASSWIAVTGTVSNPTYTFYIAAPQGVPGPTAALNACPDINFATNAPVPGDTLVCSAAITPGSPSALQVFPSSSGGSFAAGTYFWSITAVLSNGDETMPANEVAAELVGSTSSVTLNWTAPGGFGAAGYKIYRGTSATNLSVLVTTITNGLTVTYTDTGSAGTPSAPPSIGAVAGRSIWVPKSQIPTLPLLYTIPESAFTSASGVGGSTQTVCTFAMPQQAWAWKPLVLGQMQIFGLNISFTPLLVGAEVLLGDANTGTLIALGVGNSLGAVTIVPHASSPSTTTTAMTPTNSVGLVPANHTGNQGTLYFNLTQAGMAGVYDYSNSGSQAAVLVIPINS